MTMSKKDVTLYMTGGEDMAIIGKSGELLSYDSSELIEELELDIMEYGGHLIVDAIVKKINDVYFFIEYDFAPIKMKLKKDEKAVRMTASALMLVLQKQDAIFGKQ